MATSLALESAVSACSAAPVPRPPQPTSPTLMVPLPAAWTRGTARPAERVAATAAVVEPLRKSRREAHEHEAGVSSAGFVAGRRSVTEGSPVRREEPRVPVGRDLLDPHEWISW